VRLPQGTRSLGSLRNASASNQLASDYRRQPVGSQGPIPASPPGPVAAEGPGYRRPAASRLIGSQSLVGSQESHWPSVLLLVRPGLPSTASAQPPTRASASNVKASEHRALARRLSPSAGTRVPSPGCPASPASGRLHYQPGPRPGRAPSTAPPGPPEADPDPGPRLSHRRLRAPAHKTQFNLVVFLGTRTGTP
jgi:hypothetical protein